MSLDRMALDDVGANPERIADAIHQQLGERRGPVAVYEIASALDIVEIREEPLNSVEGALITTAERDCGSILANSLSSRRRRRFTVSHELGHFLIHWHQPSSEGRFNCSRADMSLSHRAGKERTRHQRQEIEANRFAIELLVPKSRLKAHLDRDPDLRHALAMAEDFDISRVAAVRRYVSLHPETLAVVFSQNGKMSYFDQREFPRLGVRRGDSMPASPAPESASVLSAVEPVDASDWLARPGSSALYAQTLKQSDGFQTTLLMVEEADEEPGDGDDAFDRFARQSR